MGPGKVLYAGAQFVAWVLSQSVALNRLNDFFLSAISVSINALPDNNRCSGTN